MKTISVLGATGSVGESTIDLILSAPEQFSVECLTAESNYKKLAAQAIAVKAKHAVIADEQYYDDLKAALSGHNIEVTAGRQAIIDAARIEADMIIGAIVGFAGLEPLIVALEHGKSVAIANKEPLVAAGPLFMDKARACGTTILPVDSEHNGVFQIFDEANKAAISRIVLTASGGPFRTWDAADMDAVTPQQAVAHPNWSMGAKISVDSATLMNKALEVIEACILFDMPPEQVEVLVHPQSIVHAMVEYNDGSILTHMGAPDMRTPIAHVLAWPDRMKTSGKTLDLSALQTLDFEQVDHAKFPAVQQAYDCLKRGQAACVTFNAANEVAVAAFLAEEISFTDIYKTVDHMVKEVEDRNIENLDALIAFNDEIRQKTRNFLEKSGLLRAA